MTRVTSDECFLAAVCQPAERNAPNPGKPAPRTLQHYRAYAETCSACPLAEQCLRKSCTGRQVTHEQHEERCVAHAKKRSTVAAKAIYKTRQRAGERPFSMMKRFFGVDQFLTRGLDCVSQDHDWLSAGFNLHRLMALLRHSTGAPYPTESSSQRRSQFDAAFRCDLDDLAGDWCSHWRLVVRRRWNG